MVRLREDASADQERAKFHGVPERVDPPPKSSLGVGFPHITLLEAWGRVLDEAFGSMPYLVGSAQRSKTWRDVDVRIMFDADGWRRWFGDTLDLYPRRLIGPWAVMCTAISVWGREWTGLPIDFQFQTRDEGNKEGGAGDRHPLGIHFYEAA